MQRIVDDAIVLRHWDYSETSQTVALLTARHGAVRGLAKGSKRPAEARFSGGFELLTRGEVGAILKPTTELATLTEWDLKEPCHPFRATLLVHRAGMYLVDLAFHAVTDADPHPDAFEALAGAMEALTADTHSGAVARTLLSYQWKMLGACGYEPRVELDAEALRARDRFAFSPHIGVLGAHGSVTDRNAWAVRRETAAALVALSIDDADAIASLDAVHAGRAARLLSVYWRALLDRDLPTRTVLFRARRSA